MLVGVAAGFADGFEVQSNSIGRTHHQLQSIMRYSMRTRRMAGPSLSAGGGCSGRGRFDFLADVEVFVGEGAVSDPDVDEGHGQ